MRDRLRRRRARARLVRRGLICEDRMYSGPYFGALCIYRVTGYNRHNDIYVCGLHARAYLAIEPVQQASERALAAALRTPKPEGER